MLIVPMPTRPMLMVHMLMVPMVLMPMPLMLLMPMLLMLAGGDTQADGVDADVGVDSHVHADGADAHADAKGTMPMC